MTMLGDPFRKATLNFMLASLSERHRRQAHKYEAAADPSQEPKSEPDPRETPNLRRPLPHLKGLLPVRVAPVEGGAHVWRSSGGLFWL